MRLKIIIEKWKSWNELTPEEQEKHLKLWMNNKHNMQIFQDTAEMSYNDEIQYAENYLPELLKLENDNVLIVFDRKKLQWESNSQGWYIPDNISWTDFIAMKEYSNYWHLDSNDFESIKEYNKYTVYKDNAYVQANNLLNFIKITIDTYHNHYTTEEEAIDFIIENDIEFCVESEVVWNKDTNIKEKIC